MDQLRALHLAQLVLGVHALVALFVVFGMIVVPVGAAQRWTFVRGFSFRAVHLGIVLIIALQKVLGATCFLSVWEFELLDAAGGAATRMPALQAFTIGIIHWDMPLWFFTALYLLVLAYTIVLWRFAPPHLPGRLARPRGAA